MLGQKRPIDTTEENSKKRAANSSSKVSFYPAFFSSLVDKIVSLWQPAQEENAKIEEIPEKIEITETTPPPYEKPMQDVVPKEPQQPSLSGMEDLIVNFYQNAQSIIETFYLQPLPINPFKPLPKIPKSNLKDGYIEREQFGGMHAARMQFYALILHKLFKTLFPEYCNTSIKILSESLNLNEQEIITLIRYTLLFYNSAIKSESENIFWDIENVTNLNDYLHSKRISNKITQIFNLAAVHKDKSDNYAHFLLQQGISANDIKAFDYLRKLIYLSERFDMMRMAPTFTMLSVLKSLQEIEEYHPKIHDEIMNHFARHVHDLLNAQKDMLVGCRIVLSTNTLITQKSAASYSLREKVAYEHADNVCSVIGAMMLQNPFFTEYLKDEQFQSTTKASQSPGYKPHIHGTNASAFTLLEKTGMQMRCPMEVVEQFKMAPMSGELTDGIAGFVKECKPCFGRLVGPLHSYCLDRILLEYSSRFDFSNFKKKAGIEFSKAFNKSFGNINILLISLLRMKQLDQEVLSPDELQEMIANMQATVQYYYLILLIGNFIFPDFSYLNILEEDHLKAYNQVILEQLTYQSFVAKIRENKLDIKSLFDNPTKDKIESVLSLFKLDVPKSIHIPKSCGSSEKKEVVFLANTRSQLFTSKTPSQRDIKYEQGDYFTPAHFPSYLSCNTKNYSIANLLAHLICKTQTVHSLQEMREKLIYLAKELERKAKLFEEIALTSNEAHRFNPRQKFFLENPFPLIFICEEENNFELLNYESKEYRAKKSLQIGVEINTIATDTNENRLIVMKYLEDNHIYNVKVVLFADLKKSKESHQPPQSPYAHNKDGFPKLSWLAARKVQNRSIETKLNKLVESAQLYNKLNFS